MYPNPPPQHRKRKRRRATERCAVPAQLVLDHKLNGDTALISEDLYHDLFPSSQSVGPNTNGIQDDEEKHQLRYVAIQSQDSGLVARPDRGNWTIIQVNTPAKSKSAKHSLQSTISLSPSATFLRHFHSANSRDILKLSSATSQGSFDIYILDVLPIPLDTVVLYIDEAGLAKEVGDTKLGHAKENGSPPDRRAQAVRRALGSTRVVRSGDVLELSLQSPNVSEIPSTLASIEFCEPVSQGLLCEWTKIVIVPHARRKVGTSKIPRALFPRGVGGDDEDTSNEHFYSATEEQEPSPNPRKQTGGSQYSKATPTRNTESLSSDDSSDSSDTDLSDSVSDAVGLSLPSLPLQAISVLSDFGSANLQDDSADMNGLSPPPSVISGHSTSTIRPGREKARVFSTQEIISRIPDENLYPKPMSDEDEEARVFTDTTSLSKLGCFSGDWVKIEIGIDSMLDDSTSATSKFLNSNGEATHNLRVVKIYALPHNVHPKSKYNSDKSGRWVSNVSNPHNERSSQAVFMSPLLLANIGSPSSVRISIFEQIQARSSRKAGTSRHRITNESLPPFAKEVEIRKLATPLATERSLQASIFQALTRYFLNKSRVVKTGDLIGLAIDDGLGHATYRGSIGTEDAELDEVLMSIDQSAQGSGTTTAKIAWFKVGTVVVDSNSKEAPDASDSGVWGGAVTIKFGVTRLAQTTTEYGKIPPTLSSNWPYYLGTKRLPAASYSSIGHVNYTPGNLTSYVSNTRRRLRELISVATSPQAIHFNMPPVAVLINSTQKHSGKATVALNACSDLGLHTFTIDAFELLSEGGATGGDVTTAGLLEARAEKAMTCGAQYTALIIKHIDVLTADRMVSSLQYILTICRVLLATTTDLEKVHEGVRSLFVHELQISAPDEKEREGLLQDIIQTSSVAVAPDVNMSTVALKTAALVAGDLVDVVDRAVVAREERMEKLATSATAKQASTGFDVKVRDIQLAGGDASRCVIKADFDVAVDAARKNFADAIGAPKIPNVTWDDVGGLSNVKDAVMETIQLPLERPELFAKGMKKRSGILFYGPPGTGKTLLAKAIATEFSLNFFSVKGPEMLNMYVGESEANVRRVFQRARDARPCVVFFDELDSVAPRRGKSGDSQGVMDRIVSQLLAELDGMSDGEGGGVFVIGATNRPDLLDQALLRPGRFDKMLYLGVSDTHEKQLTILEALTRKFTLHPNLSLAAVASALSFTYTGADLYALCSDAMLKAITYRATSVDNKIRDINAERAAATPPLLPITVAYFFDHLAGPADTEVVVDLDHFQSAIRELVPSVSVKELEHYNDVRQEFEKGEVKKGVHADRPSIMGSVEAARNGMKWGNGDPADHTGMNDEEFILRTEGMTLDDYDGVDGLNGDSWDGMGKGKGKGKHVAASEGNGFGDAEEGDEDMYNG